MSSSQTTRKILSEFLSDTERQLKNFSDNVPFEYNPDVYSPRLLNLLLVTCAQIEALCWFFMAEFSWALPQNQGMKWVISQLDQNNVLSQMKLKSTLTPNLICPFSGSYAWWTKYNDSKHDLVTKSQDVKYADVIDAISAYFALFNLAVTRIETTASEADLLSGNNWDLDSHRQFWSSEHLFVTDTAYKDLLR